MLVHFVMFADIDSLILWLNTDTTLHIHLVYSWFGTHYMVGIAVVVSVKLFSFFFSIFFFLSKSFILLKSNRLPSLPLFTHIKAFMCLSVFLSCVVLYCVFVKYTYISDGILELK